MKILMMKKPIAEACLLAGLLVAPISWAETSTMMSGMECQAGDANCMNHEGMNHEGMNHEGMNHEGMNHEGMDHGQMDHSMMNQGEMHHEGMNHEGMNHEGMNHEGMDHSQMDHSMMNQGEMHHEGMSHENMDHSQMDHSMMNQGEMPHEGMNHEGMNHEGMDHGQMDHSMMNQGEMPHEGMNHEGMNHENMDHGQMDHSSMRMQGGSAPTNARDPNAYSGGYTLTSGPYARKGPRQLRLADEHRFSALMIDHFEWSRHDGDTSQRLSGEYWYGTTWERAVVQLDGERQNGATDAELGVYWRHALTAFWNTQLGARHDSSDDLDRNWVGVGFQGLAPYWFESQAMLFVGKQGVTQLELEAEYDLLFTQRWILGLDGALTATGKRDPEGAFGQGLNSTQFGARLRYEFSRRFAPYFGVERSHRYGSTAAILGERASTEWVLGVKAWL
mgnify:CR=1 FL=1